MYESFYGFKEKPFNLTPDPKYLYLSARHTEAFAHLAFGHQERGGFVVLTGEVGTGKTTLARYFLNRLGRETATAVVLYPALSAAELLRATLDDLHVPAQGDTLKELVDALRGFLLEAHRAGRTVVLLIDEAQDLDPEVLEQVRLLSNLETDTEKLIQIVLMGQSELNALLARPELRQLAQRVTARFHLTPLNREETREYILHRLDVAGGADKVAFRPAALAAVYRASAGVPRLINSICDRALLAGYAAGSRTIDAEMVRRAVHEVRGGAPAGIVRRRLAALAFGMVAGGLIVGVLVAAALVSQGAPAARATRGPSKRAANTPAAAAPASVAPASVASPPRQPLERATQPSPAPSGPIAAAPGSRLAELVLSAPRAASADAAFQRVRELWGGDPLERTEIRTNADQLRRLDLPAVLEMFHPQRADTCSLALVTLEDGRALVFLMDEAIQVRWADVDALWTRQATVPWRDFDEVAGSAARAQLWLRQRLTELGYVDGGRTLAAALPLFQRDAGIVPDGRVGSRTLMALYALGDRPRPHLRGGSS